MKEVWKDIPEFKGLYQASNLGRIKTLGNKSNHKKEMIMKQRLNYKGYYVITLCKNSKRSTNLVHRLIAQAFIPNPENLPQINHRNGIKTDNNINNLEWCTNSYNQLEANRMGFCENRIKKCIEVNRKPIIQYDLEGNIINKFISLREASNKTGLSYKSMSLCACGKTKTCGGYVWRYVCGITE